MSGIVLNPGDVKTDTQLRGRSRTNSSKSVVRKKQVIFTELSFRKVKRRLDLGLEGWVEGFQEMR